MNIIDANEKHYFHYLKKDEINELLIHINNNKTKLILWEKGDEDSFETFETKGVTKTNVITIGHAGSFFSKFTISPLANKTVLLKFIVNDNLYFSTGQLHHKKGKKTYSIILGDAIYHARQRGDYRLEAGKNNDIQCKIDDVVYNGIDISAGGTSFKAPMEDEKKLTKNRIFNKCIIRLNKKKFEIPEVKIVKILKVRDRDERAKEYERLTVCIQFINMPENLDIAISNHVLMEARGEIMTKKFLK